MMIPGPPISVPRTKARRSTVTEMLNSSARPAQTPAIRLPSGERYQVRVRTWLVRWLPQYRHLIASGRISSAQYGQRLGASSAIGSLQQVAALPLREQWHGGVGE